MFALIVSGVCVATGAADELARIGGGQVVEVPGGGDAALLDYVHGKWAPALPRMADRWCADIDRQANALIEAAVTPGAGIQAAREDKRRELDRWDAEDGRRVVSAAAYPFVMAEAAAKGVQPAEVIAEIRAAVVRWRAAGARIEAIRVAGKAQVRAQAAPTDMADAAQRVLALLAQAGGGRG